MQMSMATIVTSGMKNPPKKLEFWQVLPRFWQGNNGLKMRGTGEQSNFGE